MNKKRNIFVIFVLFLAFIAVSSGTYFVTTAYYIKKDSTITVDKVDKVAGLVFDGKVNMEIPKNGIYPGWIGLSTFEIYIPKGTANEAIANYEIVMDYEVDPELNDEIEYEIYKTVNLDTHSVSVEKSDAIKEGDKFYVNDQLIFEGFSGSEDALVKGALKGKGELKIETNNYNGNMPKARYFVIYKFKNLDTEQVNMGKTFKTSIQTNIIAMKND